MGWAVEGTQRIQRFIIFTITFKTMVNIMLRTIDSSMGKKQVILPTWKVNIPEGNFSIPGILLTAQINAPVMSNPIPRNITQRATTSRFAIGSF